MARNIITSSKVAKPGVPISQAVRAGNLVFVSGITPFTKDLQIAKGDFEAQMRQVMENITNILEEAGIDFGNVVKVTVVLTRISDFEAMNRIYCDYFPEDDYPARITIEAPLAHPDFLLEIECIAEV